MPPTSSFSAAPYPGLRPFEVEESDIFFGREKQTDELLGKLQQNRFLAVIGPSGCGKSSLVRAGLISALETGFMSDAGSRWRVARMRPGDRPMRRLAESLLTPALLGPEQANRLDAALFIEAALRRGPLGLIEVAGESNMCRDANLLVLVDQFEEVFRFRSQVDPEEADAFVALLLATAAHSALPIYVILTMRSDFLGDCSLFRDLPEAINRSAYLIPRLTREECEAAIKGPARVFSGEIEPALVNRLLNEFGPDPDQLPLLQHALMRMWYRKTHPPPVDRSIRTVLTIEDYNLLGGLPRALSDHADEVMRELTADQQRLAKIIFQRLTERGIGKRDTRAPARLADIALVAGVGVPDVAAVIEAFRQEGRCFLAPLEGRLEADTLIDIGHESLIRQWKQLSAWVEDEADSSRMYGRLRDTAGLWESGQAGLWSNPDLARAGQWKQRANPTEAWASRYGQPGDFTRAMKFLTESEVEQQGRERAAQHARERALRHARRLAMTLGAVIVASLVGLVGYWYGWILEYSAYYSQFVKIEGVPAGIGALTSQQVQHRPWSVKIVRAGRFGPVRRLEAVDSRGEPTARHNIGTYLAESEETLQRREVRWEFLYDDRGRIAHEVAYDRAGNRVWGFIYSPTNEGSANVRLGHFVGADGYPRQTKGYGGGYVKIEYSAGHEAFISYRNALGEPRPGFDRAFGRRQKFDAQGRLTEMVSVGPDGKPMVDEAGNAGLSITPDAFGQPIAYVATDAAGAVTTVKEGWSKARARNDSSGNEVERAFFDEQDRPALHSDGYHRVSRTLDERGNVAAEMYWDVEGTPTLVAGCHSFRRVHDGRDNMIQETCLGIDGQPAPGEDGSTVTKLTYDGRDNVLEVVFLDASGRPVVGGGGYSRLVRRYDDRGNQIEIAYFGADGRPAATKDGYSRSTSQYDSHDNETVRAYFGTDGRAVVIATDSDNSRDPDSRPLSYAMVVRKHDENGNLIHEAYFDVNGKPMVGPEGYAAWRTTYDISGNRIEVAYLGLAGERVAHPDGHSSFRLQYDAFGRRTALEYFGVRGELTLSEGVASWKSIYDEQGNETERHFFGLDRKPAAIPQGYAGLRTRYDRRGEAIEYKYLGIDGNPVLISWSPPTPGRSGYARETVTRDARKRVLEHAYFGLGGERVSHPQGWARVVNRYDLRGTDPVENAYFDVNDRPVKIQGGYHATKRRLDVYGRVIEVAYYDEHGAPVRTADGYAKLVNRYDSYGRHIERAVFAADGSPSVGSTGIHRYVHRYDDRGRRLEERYFGARNEPVRFMGAFQHVTRFGYDDRGHTIEIVHFNIDGTPALGPHISKRKLKLCTRWTGKYDAQGRLLTSTCENKTARRR